MPPDSAATMTGCASQSSPDGSSRLRRNLRYCTWDGILAVPTVFLATPGNVVITVLLTQYFHLNTTQFGIIVALQAVCNALQLGIVPRLNHHYTAKQLSVFGAWVQWAAFLGLTAMLYWLPPEKSPGAFLLLFLVLLLQAAMQALVAITWPSWVQEFSPVRIRGKYFGRRNAILQIVTVVYLAPTGLWLEKTGRGSGATLRDGLIILIGVSMLIRIGSIWMQQRTYSPLDLNTTPAETRMLPLPWLNQLQEILRQRNLMIYFGFGAAFGFTSNLLGPFFNVFMLDVLNLTASQVTMLILLPCVTGAFAMAGWGRLIDRFGNQPVMVFCLLAWIPTGYVWAIMTPERLWLLQLQFILTGVFAAGFVQGVFGLLLKIVPPETKTVAISINAAVTAVPAAIAPIIAGVLLDACVSSGWNKLAVYQWAAAIHHTLILLTVLILVRVKEPRSQPVGELVGAMRSYRQIASVLGLSFLTDYVFFRKK
jgi:Na+/melibiose symporter-like transporter